MAANSTPLVIVEGFLGGAGPLLWGNFGKHAEFDSTLDDERLQRRVIFTRYVVFGLYKV